MTHRIRTLAKPRIGALVRIKHAYNASNVDRWIGQIGVVIGTKIAFENRERWVVMLGETTKDWRWFYTLELEVLG